MSTSTTPSLTALDTLRERVRRDLDALAEQEADGREPAFRLGYAEASLRELAAALDLLGGAS